MSALVTQIRRNVLTQWVEAFNARDLDGMLSCLSVGVDFHPLRLDALRGSYHGHNGVREWFVQLMGFGHPHRIVLADLRDLGDGHVFAIGHLTLPDGEPDVGPFCALHQLNGRLIVAAHHYLAEPDMIERVTVREDPWAYRDSA